MNLGPKTDMNKKEQALVEKLLTQSALRATSEVKPDVPIPESWSELVKGWKPIAAASTSARVEQSCSTGGYHAIGSWKDTRSQQPIKQYSTKLLALKALRWEVEQDCAHRLRVIDRQIEAEETNPTHE